MVLGLEVAVAARAHIGEGIAAPGGLDRHLLDALLDQLGVVDVAGAELAACCAASPDRVACTFDTTSTVPTRYCGALLDGEGDDEALAGRIVLADRRDDAHVGIAVLEIEAAQQIAVGLDAVRIVDVGGLQEAQPVALGRS